MNLKGSAEVLLTSFPHQIMRSLSWLLMTACLGSCRSTTTPETAVLDAGVSTSPWADVDPLVFTSSGPTYHVIDGYDPIWLTYIQEGVERARTYWGSYGPTHVWVVGQQDGRLISEDAKQQFIDKYCTWRTASSERTVTECRPYARRRFIEVMERGEPEAYLSDVRDTEQRMAELVFINVHEWYYEEDAIPDPILRGIHEYTHVFQQSVGPMPTWMAEGGAVFIEAWLPKIDGRRDPKDVMSWIMERAQRMRHSGFTIADMEEIETAPEEVAQYYLELAYDSGAWATVFMIHQSPTQSVSSLKNEFYPLVKELGWEAALAQYLNIESKDQFYEDFEAFMDLPIQEQLRTLEAIRP